MGTRTPLATILRFGLFELDLQAEELRKSGVRLKLQKQPLQVLKVLVERSGEIVSREELRSEIWAADTFVDFDNSLNTAVNKLRDVLGDISSSPSFIETVPRRGYRFIAPVTANGPETSPAPVAAEPYRPKWKLITAIVVPLTLLVAASLVWFSRPRHSSAEKNTIVLADFVNRTGDPVFDATLRQGLSVQLEQSPLLRAIPEEQIVETLQMMGRDRSTQLSTGIAREVCERNNAAVTLDGSIASLGSRYDLVLQAFDCLNGDLLASVEADSQDKDHVMDAVSKLASGMREKLGESLSSVRQYDVPLARATTPSLEALRCYTQGIQTLAKFDYTGSLSWFQKATELDPNFALAYWAMGDVYATLGQDNPAIQYTQAAFELRERVSERERALIEAHYYYYVLGDVEKARRSCEILSKTYPYSEDAHTSLAAFAEAVGQYDVGLAEYLEALRLAPRRSFLYRDVGYTYLLLDRVDDASALLAKAHQSNLDANLAPILYSIAFYHDDPSEMARQVASSSGKPQVEDLVLAMDADTAAYYGQLKKARTLSTRAAQLSKRAEQKGDSSYYAASAVREALFGNAHEAQVQAALAMKSGASRDVDYAVALASLYAGNPQRGQMFSDELAKKFSQDTVVKCNYLPALRAKLAILRAEPQEAIDVLAPAGTCDLGLPSYSYYNWANLFPAYVRGEAYLAGHRGKQAAAEFEKVISHRGLVLNEPIGALAHLELGRAYLLSGDTAKSRAAYRNFLALWKNADSDIPVLKQAKAEYAKLPAN